jgi:hypothetical protein
LLSEKQETIVFQISQNLVKDKTKRQNHFFSSKTEHCCYSGVIIIRLKRLLDNLDTKPTKKVKNKEGIKKRD